MKRIYDEEVKRTVDREAERLELCVGGMRFNIKVIDGAIPPAWRETFVKYKSNDEKSALKDVQLDLSVIGIDDYLKKFRFVAAADGTPAWGKPIPSGYVYESWDLKGELVGSKDGCARGEFAIADNVEAIERLLCFAIAQFCPFYDGLLVHASGVVRGGDVYIFSGDSGAGKTTISTRLNGVYDTFAVDRVVLVAGEDGVYAYPTPFSDVDRVVKSAQRRKVRKILFIKKAEYNRVRGLDKYDSFMNLMKNTTVLVSGHASELAGKMMAVGSDVVDKVDCYSMQFKKDLMFWEMI